MFAIEGTYAEEMCYQVEPTFLGLVNFGEVPLLNRQLLRNNVVKMKSFC